MADPINVKGLDRAAVLMALHDAAIPKALHGGYPDTPLPSDEAEAMLEETETFAYVNGRALFFTFEGDLVHVSEYDSRNGRACAERALAPLIAKHLRDTAPEDPEGDKRFAEAINAMGGVVTFR
jgi:hypothetical protein